MNNKNDDTGAGRGAGAGVAVGAPPVYLEPDYPALVRELGETVDRVLRELGVQPGTAGVAAEAVAEHVREEFGGQTLYWARGRALRRTRAREQMWAAFNGRNHGDIARTMGVSVQWVYKELRRMEREQTSRDQGDLFRKHGGGGDA